MSGFPGSGNEQKKWNYDNVAQSRHIEKGIIMILLVCLLPSSSPSGTRMSWTTL